MLLPALIGGGALIGGALIGSSAAKETNEAERINNEKNRAMQREFYNENWQRQQTAWARDDTAVSRRAADLKEAGLSPLLAAGSAAAPSQTSTSMPTIPSKRIHGGAQKLAIKDALTESLQLFGALTKISQQEDIVKANVRLTEAKAEEIEYGGRHKDDGKIFEFYEGNRKDGSQRTYFKGTQREHERFIKERKRNWEMKGAKEKYNRDTYNRNLSERQGIRTTEKADLHERKAKLRSATGLDKQQGAFIKEKMKYMLADRILGGLRTVAGFAGLRKFGNMKGGRGKTKPGMRAPKYKGKQQSTKEWKRSKKMKQYFPADQY